MSNSHDALDPRWFPASYDMAADQFMFTRLNDETVRMPFLDSRIGDAWTQRLPASITADMLPGRTSQPAWLFHSAFCCSTLLAHALHMPPASVTLKEPSALNDLAQLSLSSVDGMEQRLDQRLDQLARLLARPWAPHGHVLVKPSNAANRLIPRLLAAKPRSPALLMHGSLEEFLLSCFKKLPGAEEPLRWMVQYLLPGTHLQQALSIPANHAFNPVEASVLIWHAQMEIYADVLGSDTESRIRSLDMGTLLDSPGTVVDAAGRWLGLPLPYGDRLATHVQSVFARNSKSAATDYDPDTRRRERQQAHARYRPLVDAALEWAQRTIGPAARLPVDWKPLMDTQGPPLLGRP